MGISIATEKDEFYIPVGHKNWGISEHESQNLTVPADYFTPYGGVLIFHNAKFDLQVLRRLGLEIPTGQIWDTMLMHHFIDENIKKANGGHDLDTLGKRYLNDKKEKALSKAMKASWEKIPPYVMDKYASQDARITYDLFHVLKMKMKPQWVDQWVNYDRRFMLLLDKLETQGLLIDRELCQTYERQSDARMLEIHRQLGFDPAKPSQLHPKLFQQPPVGLGLAVPSRTPTGKPQVSMSWLSGVGHPTTALVLEYRKTSKQKSSYFSAYLSLTTRGYARLHPTFQQHGTATGRLSCKEPNLQQIPREEYQDAYVKKVFLPEIGKQLWEIDYRTLEYRLSAVYAQEPVLLEIFRNEGDFHQQVADDLQITRHAAKTVNYLMSFGGGIDVLKDNLHISYGAAAKIHGGYKKTYSRIFQKADDAQSSADATGEIDMWYGRTRHFQYAGEHRKAFNAVIQGGSFEIVKRSMLNLEEAGVVMSNQVHDSVWINVDTEQEVIEAQHLMSDWTTKVFGLTFNTDRKRLK